MEYEESLCVLASSYGASTLHQGTSTKQSLIRVKELSPIRVPRPNRALSGSRKWAPSGYLDQTEPYQGQGSEPHQGTSTKQSLIRVKELRPFRVPRPNRALSGSRNWAPSGYLDQTEPYQSQGSERHQGTSTKQSLIRVKELSPIRVPRPNRALSGQGTEPHQGTSTKQSLIRVKELSPIRVPRPNRALSGSRNWAPSGYLDQTEPYQGQGTEPHQGTSTKQSLIRSRNWAHSFWSWDGRLSCYGSAVSSWGKTINLFTRFPILDALHDKETKDTETLRTSRCPLELCRWVVNRNSWRGIPQAWC